MWIVVIRSFCFILPWSLLLMSFPLIYPSYHISLPDFYLPYLPSLFIFVFVCDIRSPRHFFSLYSYAGNTAYTLKTPRIPATAVTYAPSPLIHFADILQTLRVYISHHFPSLFMLPVETRPASTLRGERWAEAQPTSTYVTYIIIFFFTAPWATGSYSCAKVCFLMVTRRRLIGRGTL
ncbi:hypothetical protein BD779DRAFT_913816 [Infundibulicybe gibba]|nr:hypothetical protein BD779DRAFT_913816 [Infundibulicybe gibba]